MCRKKRSAAVEIEKKAKQKKRLENIRTGGKKDDKKEKKPVRGDDKFSYHNNV